MNCPACGTPIPRVVKPTPCRNIDCKNQYAAVWAVASASAYKLTVQLDTDVHAVRQRLPRRVNMVLEWFRDAWECWTLNLVRPDVGWKLDMEKTMVVQIADFSPARDSVAGTTSDTPVFRPTTRVQGLTSNFP